MRFHPLFPHSPPLRGPETSQGPSFLAGWGQSRWVELVFWYPCTQGTPLVVVSLWAGWGGCIWIGSRVGQNGLESIPGWEEGLPHLTSGQGWGWCGVGR